MASMKTINSILLVLFALFVVACTPTTTTRGNIVEDFRITEVTPGVSNKTNVLKSLGSPTTIAPFDENVWYYIGQKMEKKGIFDPKVVEEQVLVVAFDPEGIVQTIERVDASRNDIPKVRRKTHTGGNDVGIVEQLLGNVGRFNTPDQGAIGTSGGANP